MHNLMILHAGILLALAALSHGETVLLPIAKYPRTQDIKYHEVFFDSSCDIDGIVSRRVGAIGSAGEEKEFEPCRSHVGQLEITDYTYAFYKEGSKPQSKLLTNFQQIKHSQFELDSYLQMEAGISHVYVMLRTGEVEIYEIRQGDGKITYLKTLPAPIEQGELLEIGYFSKMGANGSLLFINNQHAFRVTLNSIDNVAGYGPIEVSDNFETAINIAGGKFLAVCAQKNGITVYSYSQANNSLKKELYLGKEALLQEEDEKELVISDLVYADQSGFLMVLDRIRGLFKIKIEVPPPAVSQSQSNQINQTVSTFLQHEPPILMYKEALCDLLCYDGITQNVYMSCQAHIIKLHPRKDGASELLPHPEIKIREMQAWGRLVMFTGRNVFRVYDDEAKGFLQYYQSPISMNRLHFIMENSYSGRFFFTNEYMLIQGSFAIVSPYVTCQATDPKYIANQYKLLITSTGPCDEAYISKFYQKWQMNAGEKPFDYSSIDYGQDTCEYKIEQRIYFWVPGKINTQGLQIALIIFACFGCLVMAVWGLYQFKIHRLTRMLEQFETVEDQSLLAGERQPKKRGSDKHIELVEEDDGKSSKIPTPDSETWKEKEFSEDLGKNAQVQSSEQMGQQRPEHQFLNQDEGVYDIE